MNRGIAAVIMYALVAQAAVLGARTMSQLDLRDLRGSLHCLVNGPLRMLGTPNAQPISLIFSNDDHNYAGERHLWLFVKRGSRTYDVFDVEIIRVPYRVYSVVNNATIRRDGRTIKELGALLGGIWTHDVMEKNFRKALRSKEITIWPFDVVKQRLNCRSYDTPNAFH